MSKQLAGCRGTKQLAECRGMYRPYSSSLSYHFLVLYLLYDSDEFFGDAPVPFESASCTLPTVFPSIEQSVNINHHLHHDVLE